MSDFEYESIFVKYENIALFSKNNVEGVKKRFIDKVEIFRPTDFTISFDHLVSIGDDEIARSKGSVVYRKQLSGINVAVKVVNVTDEDGESNVNLLTELSFLKAFPHHPNGFLGAGCILGSSSGDTKVRSITSCLNTILTTPATSQSPTPITYTYTYTNHLHLDLHRDESRRTREHTSIPRQRVIYIRLENENQHCKRPRTLA